MGQSHVDRCGKPGKVPWPRLSEVEMDEVDEVEEKEQDEEVRATIGAEHGCALKLEARNVVLSEEGGGGGDRTVWQAAPGAGRAGSGNVRDT